MKPKDLYEYLVTYFGKDPKEMPSVFIWGPPGIGKSEILKEAARHVFVDSAVEAKFKDISEDCYCKDIRLTLSDPTDIRGLPAIKESVAIWLPPSQLPKEGRDAKRGVVFFDELVSAPPAVQVTVHRLILDRSVEEYKLPDGWFTVAAGNRRMDRATVYELAAPLSNRFVHFELEADLDDWKEWAFAHGINSKIISFLNWRPTQLLNMDVAKDSRSFPTPRSWGFVSREMNAGLNDNILLEAIEGCVGKGPAAEFWGFMKIYTDLPDPKEILVGGKDIVPEGPSELYALSGAIIALWSKNAKKYAKRLLEYSQKLPAEYCVLMIRDAMKTKHKGALSGTDEFKEWSMSYRDIVL